MTAIKTAATHRTSAATKDAIALLKADHEAVGHLFAEYGNTHSVPNKRMLVAEICTALTVHAQIAQEIFYPAVKAALKGKLRVPEAAVGHADVKDLIAQIEGVEPDGKLYDAKVKALSEHVKHHVKEEQSEIFPKARASSLDMAELGARMAARKHDLLAHKL
jgi:hypothetical protein